MTPYEFLGIPRDADQDTIHAAYRNLAKRMHPDIVGGDPAAFEQLRFAHELLMDEDRRAHYDRTGEILPSGADNELAQILTMVSGALDEAVASVIRDQEDLTKVDLVQRMSQALLRHQETIEKNRAQTLDAAAKLESMLGRFSSGVPGPNHLETIVLEKLRQTGESLKNIDTERNKIARVLEFLSSYRYRSEPSGTLIYTEPPPYRPKVIVDFGDQQKANQAQASFQEQLAQEVYGIRR